MAFDGLFVFIGNKPVSDLYEGQLEMENGFVKVDPYMRTNIPGVYAAGETTDAYYRQVIISAGLGAMAAISLIKENN
jgi:thioredoxin reductase (NADPH)